MEDIRARFRPNEGRFLQPSFYRFTNEDFLKMLEDKGMETYIRPDGRIFPVAPADAKDVVAVLEAHLQDAGVRIWLDAAVTRIETEQGTVSGVLLANGDRIATRHLIVAAGGSSYPATGTTGDGWRWLESLGHSLVPLRAALAPLYLHPTPPAEWSGVALRDCLVRARRTNSDGTPGKELVRWNDDLLWTHKGLSGPAALGVAREIAEAIPDDSSVEVDLLPHESFESVRDRLIEQTKAFPRRSVSDFVEQVTPNRLVKPIFDAAQVESTVKGAYLGAKERNRLVQTLKGWNLGRVRHVPLERGEVVAGGVSLSEVDSRTMRSLNIRGLYLCGEVLDIAGPVGGYNLQAAWSTGFVAGADAAEQLSVTAPKR
jgi:predicted Rossmann fold flavoprotein